MRTPHRPTPHIPKYRHHKPSDRAVVRLDERDIYLGPHGSEESHQRYASLVDEWLRKHRPAPPPPPTPIANDDAPIAEICVKYLVHVDGYYRRRSDGTPSSEPCVIRNAIRPLVDLHGRKPVGQFGPEAFKAVRRSMIALGWCRNTINRQCLRLRAMFGWATEEELIPPHVYQALCAVKGLKRGHTDAPETEPVRPVPQHQIDAILELVSRQVRAMIELQLLTGMRPAEVCRIRGTEIEQKGKIWTYSPPTHKTAHHGHVRKIWLGPRAQEIVKEFFRPDLAAPLFCPREAEIERNEKRRQERATPLSPSALRRRRRQDSAGGARAAYDVGAYRRAIARACDVAFPPPAPLAKLAGETSGAWRSRLSQQQRKELKAWRVAHRWHPHQLRHNAATELRARYGLEAARIILGHKSAAMTAIYAEQDEKAAERIMGEVG